MSATPRFDAAGFMAAVRSAAHRRNASMKDVSEATGVSETTLSRMNAGNRMCDAASVAVLSAWAGINPARFVSRQSKRTTKIGAEP